MLLRKCDIKTCYLLVRSKKGKDVNSRIEMIFDDPLFDRLKQEKPKFRHRIVAITGDCVLPGLGICAAERAMLQQNVQIVFHVAATVRFDEKLKLALGINVCGTREILQLAREMADLKAFVHVSTAYSNCNRSEVQEKYYRVSWSLSPEY
jgi:alcohol-forming fatty acyl-CoA reductase